MTREEILEAVKALGFRLEWHSFRAVPSTHSFATWNIPSKDFGGADMMAFICRYPLNVTFFYRESKTPEDFKKESKFEKAVRAVGDFSCVMDYDSSEGLFYTQYTFNLNDFMEDA